MNFMKIIMDIFFIKSKKPTNLVDQPVLTIKYQIRPDQNKAHH